MRLDARMEMEADGVGPSDQAMRTLQAAISGKLVLDADQVPRRRHQNLPRMAHAVTAHIAVMGAFDPEIVTLIAESTAFLKTVY